MQMAAVFSFSTSGRSCLGEDLLRRAGNSSSKVYPDSTIFW
jgi:hypothetical protein